LIVKKILVIRFSSIGDIVLTTPIIRCIKNQIPGCELHYVTKEQFKETLAHNPYIDKLHTFSKDISELFFGLKNESYDLLIDLHKNLRSFRLKQKLDVKAFSFDKINLRKFMAVTFKTINVLPPQHIVDRYFEAVSGIGVKNDGKGLDYYISQNEEVDLKNQFGLSFENFIVLVVGGSYYTKQIPLNKLIEICTKAKLPIVLLGAKEDVALASKVQNSAKNVYSLCGKLSLNQSASVIRQSFRVITPDTGLMHIAAAFHKKIISVWGNTIPEFGMSPYQPNPENRILEAKNLKCRPCSKLGYKKCPKGHFKCMNEIDLSFVSQL
jgi:ADP-heptose:LPS heptosyltransferase